MRATQYFYRAGQRAASMNILAPEAIAMWFGLRPADLPRWAYHAFMRGVIGQF